MNESISSLDRVVAHQNRIVGAQEMQRAALLWAVANKEVLSQQLIDGLIEALENQLVSTTSEK